MRPATSAAAPVPGTARGCSFRPARARCRWPARSHWSRVPIALDAAVVILADPALDAGDAADREGCDVVLETR